MTDAKETKLTIWKLTLERMCREKENEIHYYANRYKTEVSPAFKEKWKDSMYQCKAEYEALDYAIELIKGELGEKNDDL